MSENWLPEDESIYLVHNWTDVREAIEVRLQNGTGDWNLVENNTITSTEITDWVNGQHVIYNETEIRETHIILNGKDRSANPYHESTFKLTGIRCIGGCVEEVDFDVDSEDF